MEAQIDNFINSSRLYILESCIEIKINLNFYFRTSFWCLKRFEAPETFRGTTKKCEKKNLS